MSTTASADIPVREKTSIPAPASVDNANANGAPPPAVATTAPPGDGTVKLTALELKAQKKAEKAAKRQQVIQNRQGGAAPTAPAGAAGAILSPQANKAAPKGGKESGKGQHKRAASTAGDSKNAHQNNAPVEPPAEDKTVELFRHLYKPRAKTIAGAKDVHPAVLSLGQQMSNYVICGSNARLVATLRAFKRVINSYTTPPGTTLTRHMSTHVLSPQIEYLTSCRPMSISMGTAIRWLKLKIAKVDPDEPDAEAKESLCADIDEYIRDRVTLADAVIAKSASNQCIKDGDVILTYAKSSVVQQALIQAYTDGRRFRVIVVDSRPLFEGKALAKALINFGLDVKYCLMNGVSHCMKEVTKVLLGAHAMMSNGVLYSRIGTSQIAMEAKDYDVPVIVLCESVKCTERVALDSIVFNEVADPDELLIPSTKPPAGMLYGWRDVKNLQLLNLLHDVTPADYITMIVTELGIVPPSSVPVLQRLANEGQPSIYRAARVFSSKSPYQRAMHIKSIPMSWGKGDNYAYLVIDEKTKDAVIIDPAYTEDVIPTLSPLVKSGEINLTAIVNTHHHRDHAGGNRKILSEYADKKLPVIGGKDSDAVTQTPAHNGGFSFGSIAVKALHTPCHTQDSICWFMQDGDQKVVFTGDTLFHGGCGRFFEGSAEEMDTALNKTLGSLPDDTKVYPGHEYTKANAKFGESVSKSKGVAELVKVARENEQTTGRWTIADEKKHNVFMMLGDAEIQKATGQTEPDHWDSTSYKPRDEQKKGLVQDYLSLGWRRRIPFRQRATNCPRGGLAELPQGVPRDLLSPLHRQALGWGAGLFWIRTWFGNEEVRKEDADAAYARLCGVVTEEVSGQEFLDRPTVFEDEGRFADRSGGSGTHTGATQPYVLEAFCDYPDILERRLVDGKELEEVRYLDENPEEEEIECWLVVVADREACEEGTVLFMEIDGFGEMMPGRLRVPPRDVVTRINCYINGQHLSLETEQEEGEIYSWCDGDPWDHQAPTSSFILLS
ncbi:hypothetical protein V495_05926 [Pseudogymnoascus sp. VKM F-4514 (FW-929)]|nr:hypothetical protein V495_05926 [Pseudogymnoascus sp. VKM F-4514 (FW-929)]KFY61960.1 hypothetical protein V497_02664 [Pseudogymnoascus sp. VKM F-4516 (FW-969)]